MTVKGVTEWIVQKDKVLLTCPVSVIDDAPCGSGLKPLRWISLSFLTTIQSSNDKVMIMMTMIDAGKTGLERVVERAPDNRYGQTRFSPSWSKVDNIRTEEVSIISRSSQICFLGNATHLEWKQFLESRIYRAYLCSSASSSNILVRQRLWHFYSFVTRLFSSGQKEADAL